MPLLLTIPNQSASFLAAIVLVVLTIIIVMIGISFAKGWIDLKVSLVSWLQGINIDSRFRALTSRRDNNETRSEVFMPASWNSAPEANKLIR